MRDRFVAIYHIYKNKIVSNSTRMCFGIQVPQGLILGPILYILYSNNITFALDKECAAALYVDDCSITFSNVDQIMFHSKINSNMNRLLSWFRPRPNTLYPNAKKPSTFVSTIVRI